MIFKVTEVNPTPNEWQSAYGAMLTYYIKGCMDGGPEEQAQIGTKKDGPKVPFIGELIECSVTKEHPQYGKTIKRVPAQPGTGPMTKPLPSPSAPYVPRQEDPERQDSIIRQSSFERAILIQAKKADIFIAEKKFPEAHDAITFKTITNLSDFIARYAKGVLINPPSVDTSDLNNFDDGPGYNEEGE